MLNDSPESSDVPLQSATDLRRLHATNDVPFPSSLDNQVAAMIGMRFFDHQHPIPSHVSP